MAGAALRLWRDDGGALLSIEWVFLATILVIGTTTGLVAVRNSTNAELAQVGNATLALNQCYSFSGQATTVFNGNTGTNTLCGAATCGSVASSTPQSIGITSQQAPVPANNISVGPCGEEGIGPGLGGGPGIIQGASGTRTTPGILPASGTRTPEGCTDLDPGSRTTGTPADYQKKKDDCTDKDKEKDKQNGAGPTVVTPAGGSRDKKPN